MFSRTKKFISAVMTAILMCAMFVISPITGFADSESPIAQYKLSENLIGSSDCTTAQHTAFWDYQRMMNTADGYIKIGAMGANASKSFDKVYTEGVFVFNYSVLCGDNNYNQYYIYANTSDKKYEGTWLDEFVEVLGCRYPKTTINLIGDTSQTAPKYTNGKWANCDLVINFDDKIIQLYIDNALISTVPNTLTGLGGIMLGAKNEKSDVLNFDDIALYYTPGEEEIPSPIAQYKLSENLIGSSDCTTAQHTAFWDYQRMMNTADGYIKIGAMGANASKSFDKVYTEGVFVFNYSVFCSDSNFNQYYIYANTSDKKYEGTWLSEFVNILDCSYPKTTINLIGDTSQTAPKYTNGKWANCDLVINFDDKIIQLYIDNALISTVPNTLTGLGGIMLGAKNEKAPADLGGHVLNFDDIALYYTAPKKFTATEMKVVKENGTEVTLPSDIAVGDKLTLSATLHNTMGEEKPYMVSYAVYNGNMLTAVDFIESTLANNGAVTKSFDYTVTNTENLKIKILVWDGIATMTPYDGCYYAIQ